MYNNRQYVYKNITTISSPVIFTGAGLLHSIVVNNQNGGGTITITDTASPSVTLGTIKLSASQTSLPPFLYDAGIAGGLQITTSASPDVTVMYDRY